MSKTAAGKLLLAIRQQTRVTGFVVSLSERRAFLLLSRESRSLPERALVITFFTCLAGGCVKHIDVFVGGEVVATYDLVDGKRWRETRPADADPALDDVDRCDGRAVAHNTDDGNSNPPAAPAIAASAAPKGDGGAPGTHDPDIEAGMERIRAALQLAHADLLAMRLDAMRRAATGAAA